MASRPGCRFARYPARSSRTGRPRRDDPRCRRKRARITRRAPAAASARARRSDSAWSHRKGVDVCAAAALQLARILAAPPTPGVTWYDPWYTKVAIALLRQGTLIHDVTRDGPTLGRSGRRPDMGPPPEKDMRRAHCHARPAGASRAALRPSGPALAWYDACSAPH